MHPAIPSSAPAEPIRGAPGTPLVRAARGRCPRPCSRPRRLLFLRPATAPLRAPRGIRPSPIERPRGADPSISGGPALRQPHLPRAIRGGARSRRALPAASGPQDGLRTRPEDHEASATAAPIRPRERRSHAFAPTGAPPGTDSRRPPRAPTARRATDGAVDDPPGPATGRRSPARSRHDRATPVGDSLGPRPHNPSACVVPGSRVASGCRGDARPGGHRAARLFRSRARAKAPPNQERRCALERP